MRGCCSLASARASILVVGSLLVPGATSAATKHPAPSPDKPFAYNTTGVVGIGASPASVDGPAILQFQGVNHAIFTPKSGQTVELGQFVISPSSTANGQSTTYSDTPFEVQVRTPEFDKTNTVPVLDKVFPALGKDLRLKTQIENSLLIKGHLDGTVGANGQANVVATVDSIKLGGLGTPTSDHVTHYAFPIRFSQFKLPTHWTMSTSPVTIPAAAAPMIPAAPATVQSSPAAETLLPGPATIQPSPAAESFTAKTAMTPTLTTTPTPTPEPSTIVLFATVLGGLVLGRRRLATAG